MMAEANAAQQGNALKASDNPRESAERLARPLIRLANAWGISTSYIDQLGTYVEIRDEVLVTVLQALGVDASTDEAITTALEDRRKYEHELLAPPTIVKFLGTPKSVQLHVFGTDPRVTLILEDGSEFTGEFGELAFQAESDDVNVYTLSLNDDIPAGYHTLTFTDRKRTISCALLCAPARIPVPQAVQDQQRWGWMAQMYSVRSAGSWGVGDYGDLRMLASDAAAKSGADFMLINPIHASAPITPLEPSPYLPESRRFLNVTYIRPQDIPEFEELGERDLATVRDLHDRVAVNNTTPDPIDINAAWDAKRTALEIIFRQKRSAEREAAFAEFRRAAGDDLRAFALWCVAFEVWGAPWEEGVDWFSTTNRDSPRSRNSSRTMPTCTSSRAGCSGSPPSRCRPRSRPRKTAAWRSASCRTWPWACTLTVRTCGGAPNVSPSAR